MKRHRAHQEASSCERGIEGLQARLEAEAEGRLRNIQAKEKRQEEERRSYWNLHFWVDVVVGGEPRQLAYISSYDGILPPGPIYIIHRQYGTSWLR